MSAVPDIQTNASDEGIVFPEEFCCVITGEPLTDPVVTTNGHTFERKFIEEWFDSHETCPLDNTKMESKQLVPNFALKKLLDQYKQQAANHRKQRELWDELQQTDLNPGLATFAKKKRRGVGTPRDMEARLQQKDALLAEAMLSDDKHKVTFGINIDPQVKLLTQEFLACEAELAELRRHKAANVIKMVFFQKRLSKFLDESSLQKDHINHVTSFQTQKKDVEEKVESLQNQIKAQAASSISFDEMKSIIEKHAQVKKDWEVEKERLVGEMETLVGQKNDATGVIGHLGKWIIILRQSIVIDRNKVTVKLRERLDIVEEVRGYVSQFTQPTEEELHQREQILNQKKQIVGLNEQLEQLQEERFQLKEERYNLLSELKEEKNKFESLNVRTTGLERQNSVSGPAQLMSITGTCVFVRFVSSSMFSTQPLMVVPTPRSITLRELSELAKSLPELKNFWNTRKKEVPTCHFDARAGGTTKDSRTIPKPWNSNNKKLRDLPLTDLADIHTNTCDVRIT